MFHYLLLGYIGIYVCFAFFVYVLYAQLVPEEMKKDDKPWETPIDMILIVTGLLGMIFLLVDLRSNTIKTIWQPLSVILVLAQLYLNLKGRLEFWRSGEPERHKVEAGYADLSTILFLCPSLCLNIYYAFR